MPPFTAEHMLAIFEASRRHCYRVFISPHYFHPTDDRWHSLLRPNPFSLRAMRIAERCVAVATVFAGCAGLRETCGGEHFAD
jgi:hypothetical protein